MASCGKSLLMLLSEGVAVCNEDKLLFLNSGLKNILEKRLDGIPQPKPSPHSAHNMCQPENRSEESCEEDTLNQIEELMRQHTIQNESGTILVNKGVLELVREGVEGEFLMLGESGEVKYALTCKKIMFNELPATLLMIRDSTGTERAHHKLVEEKYRGVLLSTITHELKTPLTVISGNLELIRKSTSTLGDRSHLEAAMMAAKSLKYFLHDINVISANRKKR